MKKIYEKRREVWINLPTLKILLTMKLILVFVCGLGILSGIAGNSYAQSTKLTFALKDASVKDVLYYIEEHSEFTFMYDNNEVDVNRKVNIRVKDKTIGSILNQLFGKDEIKYQTVGRHIIIFPEGSSAGKTTMSQQNGVSGKVIDESGRPLPGVTVVVKGTTQGTVTNADGTYSFSSLPEDATLVFSFVGMKKQEVVVGNQSTINVTLAVSAIGIDEVVAIGYGTQKREDLTGSIASGDMEAITEQPNVSIMEGLQGTVPGLTIDQVNQAGQNPVISIRGQATLSGEQAPLIVLDGVIFRGELIDINPNDIKSVDILKDASATAIYGSQASNGVILLTTAKGKSAGEPSIRYTGRYSFQQPHYELRAETDGAKFMEKIMYSDIFQSRTEESGYLEPNPNWSETTNFKTNMEVNNYLENH